MLLLKVGFPTIFLAGASLVIILTSHVLRAPDHSFSKRSGPDVVVPFAVPQLNASASKVAVSFESKTLFRGSLLNVKSVNTSHHKRDYWYDPLPKLSR